MIRNTPLVLLDKKIEKKEDELIRLLNTAEDSEEFTRVSIMEEELQNLYDEREKLEKGHVGSKLETEEWVPW